MVEWWNNKGVYAFSPLTGILYEREDDSGPFLASFGVDERLVFEGKFFQIFHKDGVLIQSFVA